MENGQGFSATWSTNSDLPHRSRQGCNFSLTEGRETFPQELSHLNEPKFLRVTRDAIFWDVSRDFLHFRQQANPLVVVELLRGRIFFFSSETSAAC